MKLDLSLLGKETKASIDKKKFYESEDIKFKEILEIQKSPVHPFDHFIKKKVATDEKNSEKIPKSE